MNVQPDEETHGLHVEVCKKQKHILQNKSDIPTVLGKEPGHSENNRTVKKC